MLGQTKLDANNKSEQSNKFIQAANQQTNSSTKKKKSKGTKKQGDIYLFTLRDCAHAA